MASSLTRGSLDDAITYLETHLQHTLDQENTLRNESKALSSKLSNLKRLCKEGPKKRRKESKVKLDAFENTGLTDIFSVGSEVNGGPSLCADLKEFRTFLEGLLISVTTCKTNGTPPITKADVLKQVQEASNLLTQGINKRGDARTGNTAMESVIVAIGSRVGKVEKDLAELTETVSDGFKELRDV